MFECNYPADGCISWDKVYDGRIDCLRDGSDENNNAKILVLQQMYPNGTNLMSSQETFTQLEIFHFVCTLHTWSNQNGIFLPGSWICDKQALTVSFEDMCTEKATRHCQDRTDISFCMCGKHQWMCKNGHQCIKRNEVCNGNPDAFKCIDTSDEDEVMCNKFWSCPQRYVQFHDFWQGDELYPLSFLYFLIFHFKVQANETRYVLFAWSCCGLI